MPILYFDTTKHRKQGHLSGLNRVSARLQDILSRQQGFTMRPVHWSTWNRSYVDSQTGKAIGKGDYDSAFFTPEVFALRERPFCRGWMDRFAGRTASLYYDAIPYFHPEITWPHSVRRFPRWFSDLQMYGKVLFISAQSLEEAEEVHEDTGLPAVRGPLLPLGCDYLNQAVDRVDEPVPILLNVGIVEPRKGQDCLLTACDRLWMQGLEFKLVFLGRVNPHYGRPIIDRIHLLQQAGHDIIHEEGAGDDRLAYWHQRASLAVLPSRAEGFGLPVLEALWTGCPVLASEQPSLGSVPEQKGIHLLEEIDENSLEKALGGLLEDKSRLASLAGEIPSAGLPTWEDSARKVAQELGLPFSS